MQSERAGLRSRWSGPSIAVFCPLPWRSQGFWAGKEARMDLPGCADLLGKERNELIHLADCLRSRKGPDDW